MNGPQITMAVERISPSTARKYLELNRSNRPLSKRTILDYVRAMHAGEWLLNGEAIKFDRDGRLVDGQHRLAAIEKSGQTLSTVVMRGLDPEVFKTLDTGRNRSAGDVLAIKGLKNPNCVGVALRQLYRAVNDELEAKKRVTNSKLTQLLEEHPRFAALAEEADHAPYSCGYLPSGQVMFAFYVACHVDERRARMFFRALGGRPAAKDVAQFGAVKLRERLESVMDEIIKPAPKVRLAWVIEAWNATLAGTPVARFSRVLTELPDWDPEPRFDSEPERRAAAGGE